MEVGGAMMSRHSHVELKDAAAIRRQQREQLMARIAAVARYDETLTKQALAARFHVDTKTVTRALKAVRP